MPPAETSPSFDERKRGLGEWVFERRASIFITLIIYLSLAILFMFSRIVIGHAEVRNTVAFELDELQRFEEMQKEFERAMKLNEELSRELARSADNRYFDDVRNVVSDENAQIEELNRSDRQIQDMLRESRERFEQAGEELGRADGHVQNMLRESRERYEQGDEELRQLEERISSPRTGVMEGNVKVEGNVTVSFSLSNPARMAYNLYVPAYKCEQGGVVVVNITVGRSGEVLSASVDKTVSSSDHCMTTAAVEAAMTSRFNLNAEAPAKQTGSITYMFVPQ